jgi:hypothetical protein
VAAYGRPLFLSLPLMQTRQLVAGLAFWAVLAAVYALLAPGLDGHFIFDDFPNLEGLTSLGDDPSAWLQFIQTGASSRVGRPLSLLTFALQHDSWPAAPGAFIRINVLLHLLNGALLFWVLLRWQWLAGNPDRHDWVLPLVVTALWLVAPLQTSTVFYVVQRMTLLAGTFVLLGLLLHLAGRAAVLRGSPLRAYALMTGGAVIAGGIGTLAKESAALYPLLVLALEATLLRGVPRPTRWPAWSAVFLYAPMLLLAAYFATLVPVLSLHYEGRDFTAGERLLTEARVLWHYVLKLALPSIYSVRVLYDDYPVSRALLEPWTTLPAVLSWPALLGLAIAGRRRWPVASFAVLWFLAAHVLESTLLPLELAFEHRNYVAILGPLLAGALGVRALLVGTAARRLRPAIVAAAASYLALSAAFTLQSAHLWGTPGVLAEYWAGRQPESRRAQHHYANYLFMHRLTEEGRQVFERSLQRWPNDAVLWFGLLQMGCEFPSLPTPDLARAASAMRDNDGHVPSVIHMAHGLLRLVEDEGCTKYPPAELRRLTQALADSPSMARMRRHTAMLNSRAAEIAGDRAAAMRHLDEAITESPRVMLLRQGVVWALQGGDTATAHRYLDIAETSPAISEQERWTYRLEIKGLRQLVELYEAIANAQSTDEEPEQ